MAEDKKTRIELEEQKKIANDVRVAFGEASGRLRQRYNAEIQRVLDGKSYGTGYGRILQAS